MQGSIDRIAHREGKRAFEFGSGKSVMFRLVPETLLLKFIQKYLSIFKAVRPLFCKMKSIFLELMETKFSKACRVPGLCMN